MYRNIIWLWLILLVLVYGKTCNGDIYLHDLSGANSWILVNNNGSIKVPGTVPGGVYTDLYAAGKIPDPLYRMNDVTTRWVAYDNWTYYREFEVSIEFVRRSKTQVVFEGVDTIAAVKINGNGVGNTDNMFKRFQFDIFLYLKPGRNNISIFIYNPIQYSKHQYALQLVDYLVPPVCVPPEYHGECHVNMIRKMQASYGWDFGPAFPSMGIWRKTWIEGFDVVLVRDILVDCAPITDGNWTVTIHVTVESADTHAKVFDMIVEVEDIGSVNEWISMNPSIDLRDTIVYKFTTKKPPKLWWPAGYGEQNLYKITATAVTKGDKSVKEIKFGFRKVRLLENSVDNNQGRTFSFEINGIEIFLKGSNWIPGHILPELSTVERVRYFLKSAKDVNMNSLRVWGGGVYESDEFYQIADEMGIMIWQDIMFACSMYPTTKDFLETVQEEVQYNIARLQHHPSIIVWAANNENEAALRGNWYGTKWNFELYHSDYVKLYVNTVRNATQRLDSSRPFLVSSPTNGLLSEEEGFIAKNPYSQLYGDVHFYDYTSDMWNSSNFPKPRLSSEYGIQSMPSVDTFLTQCTEEDLFFESAFLSHRQHHPLGNSEIWNQIYDHFIVPQSIKYQLKNLIYLTQIHQAMGIKIQTEFYRRSRSEITSDGRGLTMGALYWQLNDLWAAPSWASIEFTGKWKMLHYYAKNFFSPLLLMSDVENGFVNIFAVSDLLKPANISVKLQIYKWNSFKPTSTIDFDTQQSHLSSRKIYSISLSLLLKKANCMKQGKDSLVTNEIPRQEVDPSKCFMIITGFCESCSQTIPENFLLFDEPRKSLGILPSSIKVTKVTGPVTGDEYIYTVTLSSDNIAIFVWLDNKSIIGRFSDNGFIMHQPKISLNFTTQQNVSSVKLQSDIRVMSLMDIYM